MDYKRESIRTAVKAANESVFNKVKILELVSARKPAQFSLGQTVREREVEAWYFPGKGERRALVIGGVHGSELSSVAVADELVKQLKEYADNDYEVIIIPSLFPDNFHKAAANHLYIGSKNNIGRYTENNSADPNRQMPSPGKAFDEYLPFDHMGRIIERENQLLLQLIQTFKPHRILNVHSIRDPMNAGVYADPRTDDKGIALGFEPDSALAISMARFISGNAGWVKGNRLDGIPTAVYYRDPAPEVAGAWQRRNTLGAKLAGDRGAGISLGTWASTAVNDDRSSVGNRDAIMILTMEYPGCRRPEDYQDETARRWHSRQVGVFAGSVRERFLMR